MNFPPMPTIVTPITIGEEPRFQIPKLDPTHEDIARLRAESDNYRDAMKLLGTLCCDLKEQRDARDEENRELRGHLKAILLIAQGKAKPRACHKIVIAAQEALMQPLRSSPLLPLRSTEGSIPKEKA